MKPKKLLPNLKFDSCLLCLSTHRPANSFLQCSHRFHLGCAKEWIISSNACPECEDDITNLYIETPEDCEYFYANQIRAHFSKKRLNKVATRHLKRLVAELMDNSKKNDSSPRIALRDVIIAKIMIKSLQSRKKALCCKTDYLLEITNRQLLQIRKSLQLEYQQLFENESKHEDVVHTPE